MSASRCRRLLDPAACLPPSESLHAPAPFHQLYPPLRGGERLGHGRLPIQRTPMGQSSHTLAGAPRTPGKMPDHGLFTVQKDTVSWGDHCTETDLTGHTGHSQHIRPFFFGQREWEGEREGEKHQCVVASHAPPTGDLACNPEMESATLWFAGWCSIH